MPSDPTAAVIEEALELARDAADAIATIIKAAIEGGDVASLDALAKVVDAPAVLRARDRALVESQRNRAAEVLRRGSPT